MGEERSIPGRARVHAEIGRHLFDEAAPAGHVRWRPPDPDAGLASAPLDALAAELMRRIGGGQGFDSNTYLAWVGASLQDTLGRHLDFHANPFSRQKLADLFWNLIRHVAEPVVLRDRVVVDIGPGAHNPLGFAFMLLLLGARRVIAVEYDCVSDPARACRAIVDTLAMMLTDRQRVVHGYPISTREVLANWEGLGFDLGRLRDGDPQGVDLRRLDVRRESIAQTSLGDGEADLVLSNAVLEHIPDVDAAVAELRRITRPGGFGIHLVDATDHRRYGDGSVHPLDFLRDPSREAILHSSNRLRIGQIADRFARGGFEVLQIRTDYSMVVTPETRAGFVPPFDRMPLEELGRLTGMIQARKI